MAADISVTELKERIDAGEQLHILDVREGWENEEFNINGKLIPLGELQSRVGEIDDWKEEEVIVHCKAGGRSAAACDFLTRAGFKNARNLTGGMMAWMISNPS